MGRLLLACSFANLSFEAWLHELPFFLLDSRTKDGEARCNIFNFYLGSNNECSTCIYYNEGRYTHEGQKLEGVCLSLGRGCARSHKRTWAKFKLGNPLWAHDTVNAGSPPRPSRAISSSSSQAPCRNSNSMQLDISNSTIQYLLNCCGPKEKLNNNSREIERAMSRAATGTGGSRDSSSPPSQAVSQAQDTGQFHCAASLPIPPPLSSRSLRDAFS